MFFKKRTVTFKSVLRALSMQVQDQDPPKTNRAKAGDPLSLARPLRAAAPLFPFVLLVRHAQVKVAILDVATSVNPRPARPAASARRESAQLMTDVPRICPWARMGPPSAPSP